MSSTDIPARKLTRLQRFEEMWPSVLAKLEAISGEDAPGPARTPKLAYYHLKTVMEMNPETADLLANQKIEEAVKDKRAIDELFNGNEVQLSQEQLINAGWALSGVASILGYGSKRAE